MLLQVAKSKDGMKLLMNGQFLANHKRNNSLRLGSSARTPLLGGTRGRGNNFPHATRSQDVFSSSTFAHG
jgi:hypothetical protein